MLIEFRTENYRSFAGTQRISMLAGGVRGHPRHVVGVSGERVLCAAAVFGANASGKTNIIRAMWESQVKILQGMPIPAESWNRNDPANADRPTGFEYVFTSGDRMLSYGFETLAATGEVVSEWLYDMSDGSDELMFSREGTSVKPGEAVSEKAGAKLEVLAGMLRKGEGDLMLPILARMESEDDRLFAAARRALSWFSGNLVILTSAARAPAVVYEGRDDSIRRALNAYGTGITGIEYERMDVLPPEAQPYVRMFEQGLKQGGTGFLRGPSGCIRLTYDDGVVAERTVFLHGGRRFDFNEESDGTIRLYDLLPIIERSDVEDVTFVVDELNRSLHPQLTRKFVRDFLRIAQGRRRQLVFTTHEVMLLDFDLLRRDEFWFIEKDGDGNSSTYSLEDFRERPDRRIMLSYMDGRYGAVPAFRELYPDLE